MTFYFENGRSASNIRELKKELKNIGAEEFSKHVNNDKNDFANWIENTLGDKETAEKVSKEKSKAGLLKALENKGVKRITKKVVKKEAPKVKKVTKPAAKKVEEKPVVKAEKKDAEKEELTHKIKQELSEPHVRKHIHKNPVSYISTEQPNKFILKEFLMGALFGLLLGLMLMAMIARLGY